MKTPNILAIGDTHLPFERPDYLNFCVSIADRCKCKIIVHVGDLVDNHSINYHEHDPNGKSPKDEMEETDEHLVRWFDAFPQLHLCLGNHDRLIDRKIKTFGLPNRALKSFHEMWNFPDGWREAFSWEFYGVRFTHGTGLSGKNAHIKAAEQNRQSTIIGHTHSTLAVNYLVSERDRIFGANCGCGIDRRSYAFEYGRELFNKPALGCAVVTDSGQFVQVFPMVL